MFKPFVLIVFFAFICGCWAKSFEINAVQESKIGPKECAKGSKYWCQDLRTAKSCGAVKHCIQVVWENKKLTPDNNEICETCKKMVQEARDELKSNTTQELIKEVLEGTCNIYFPIRLIADECIKLVDEFIPEFIEILSSRMDPQTVCAVAWLCNSDKMKNLIGDINIVTRIKSEAPKFLKGYSSKSDVCQDCKTFATEAIQKVKDMGENEFSNRLIEFCGKLSGALHTVCKMAAESKSHEIYLYIINDMKPDEVCALAAMCIDGLDPIDKKINEENPIAQIKKLSADPECELCIQLVTRLREVVVANSSRDETKEVLLNICSHLKMYKDECTSYVTNYFDEVYNFIIEEMNPNLLCQVFGLCVSRRLIGSDEGASYGKMYSNKVPDVKVKTPFTKSGTAQVPVNNCNPQVNNKVECVMCEYALHQLQTMLADNKTEEAIKSALERVCGLLPKSISDQCNAFIEQYGPAIFALLAQELDPSIICTELGLCSSSSTNRVTPVILGNPDKYQLPIDRMVPPNKNLAGKEECLYCQYSMELVHSLLDMNGTKDAIILGLDDVCHTLPSNWRNTCDSIVELYADSFITQLQKQNLSEVCSMLSICNGNVGVSMYPHAKMAAVAAVNHTGGSTCSICEVTVELLSKLLNNPTISADVIQAAEEVCKAAPKTSRAKCESIISLYGPYFVKMLAEFTNPKIVCQAVHLCEPPMGQLNLLGGKKCTYGPGYWCKSKIHAKACKAEDHCQKFVWKS